MKIRTKNNERVETGALVINEDWAGLFIRGDDCMDLLGVLGKILRYEILSIPDLFILDKYRSMIKNDVLSIKDDS
jgi:hypothetical protein